MFIVKYLVCAIAATCATATRMCYDDPVALRKLQRMSDTHHPRVLSLQPARTGTVGAVPHIPSRFMDIHRTPLAGSIKTCSNVFSSSRMEHRATCPWYFVRNEDKNRHPRAIVEAKCSCTQCRTPSGSRSKSATTSCQPIHYYIRVQRRVACRPGCNGQDGVNVYVNTWEPVAVGCSCIGNRVIYMGGLATNTSDVINHNITQNSSRPN